MRTRLLLAALAALCLLAISSALPAPLGAVAYADEVAPDATLFGKIVFFSGRDFDGDWPKGYDLYSINPDGSALTRITTNSAVGYLSYPAVSPDGTRIVVALSNKLLFFSANGAALGSIATPSGLMWVNDWSPTGEILITIYPSSDVQEELYSVNVATKQLRRLTNDKAPNLFASWSPDGSQIVYMSDYTLWIMKADGSQKRQIYSGDARDVDWSPDGTRIVFETEKLPVAPGYYHDLAIINVDGTGYQRITNLAGKYVWDPMWSPDGQSVAFSYHGSSNSYRPGLGMIDLASGNIRYLTPEVGDEGPFWVMKPQGFTITGRVTDQTGAGVSQVSVSYGGEMPAFTDVSGVFSITGISTGARTLTPSKSGYTFCPPNRNINITADVIDENFTGYSSSVKIASGYCPAPDGYGFANASGHSSWEIFRDTFGAENVEWNFNGHTVPKPAAWMYYHETYKCDGLPPLSCSENGTDGNCAGMSTSSMLLAKQWADPVDFLSRQRVEHTLDLSAPAVSNGYWEPGPVSDFIVRYQGYQYGREATAEESIATNRSLADSVALLKKAIDDNLAEPFVLNLRGPHGAQNQCAGHTLMPFAYEISGNMTKFYVYDPNSPRATTKYVAITPSVNMWSYDHQNSIGVWQSGQPCKQGTLTKSSIGVVPLAAWKTHPTPPWISGGAWRTLDTEESGWYELSASLNASLQVIDQQGRMTGSREGQLVVEIPGSYLKIPWAVVPGRVISQPERYALPSTSDLTLRLSHSDANAPKVNALVPNGQISVRGSPNTSKSVDNIDIAKDGSRVSLIAGAAGGDLSIAITKDFDDHGQSATISAFALQTETQAEMRVEVDGDTWFSSAIAQAKYRIEIRHSGQTSAVFYGTGPAMGAGDIHRVHFDPTTPYFATVEVDRGGNGSMDETILVKTEAKLRFLPLTVR